MPGTGPDVPEFRQQRFIEIENVGSSPIPPYGVCEVVDSYRPEKTGPYTPYGGRTVLKARLSETDEPCLTVVNGHCEVPVGEQRKVGTMDDPMVALVYEEYDPQTVVGVKAGSYMLHDEYCGYVIAGDYHELDGTMRVARREDCAKEFFVKAIECIYPGDSHKAVKPLVWDPDKACWVEDEDAPIRYVSDPNAWLLAVPDDCFKVEREPCEQPYASSELHPAFPFGLTRLVKVKHENQISAEGIGKVTLLDCYGEETECEIITKNYSPRKIACDAEYEYATLHIQPCECCWGSQEPHGWIVPMERARLGRAILEADMCEGAATAIDEFTELDVNNWRFVTPPYETVGGGFKQYACEGSKVLLAWVEASCGWMPINVEPQEFTPMLDIQCASSGCGIDMVTPKSPFYAQQCSECGATDTTPTQATGTEVEVSEIEWTCDSSCELVVKTKTVCVLCADEESTTETSIEGMTIDVVNGVSSVCSGGASGSGGGSCTVNLTTQRYCVMGCQVSGGSSIALGTPVEVVEDVLFEQDGTDLKVHHHMTTLCVLCAAGDTWYETDTVEGIDCDTGSGS